MAVQKTFFIFLQIAVIGKRQPLEHGEHAHQMSEDASAFASHELTDIGVFFLRHDGRACGIGIWQTQIAKIGIGKENAFLAEA